MKKSKLLLSLTPAIILTTTLPITITSCNKQEDVWLQPACSKTLELTEGYLEYEAPDDSLIFSLADKYNFPKSQQSSHIIKLESQGLDWDKNNVILDSGKDAPEISYTGSWGYDYKTEMCSAYICTLKVSGCQLKSGAWITFDLNATFGSTKDQIFTKISNTCKIPGFKLYFNN